jgi:hypothetical protein
VSLLTTAAANLYQRRAASAPVSAALKTRKAQKSSGFRARSTYGLGIKDRVLIDPACGSGHILVYAFDLLFAMYEEEGYNPEDIPAMILQDNLKGLEIDARAAEIAKFALEMKARGHDPHFLERNIDVDITVLVPVKLEAQELAQTSKSFRERSRLLDAMEHMGEAGSLYVPDSDDAASIRKELERMGDPHEDSIFAQSLRRKFQTMLANVEALSGTYHCVIANPPYMGSGNMGSWLSSWIKANYPDEKGDLCTCFIKRGLGLAKQGGYAAEVTMQSWMFISSYEKMRKHIIEYFGIAVMAHLDSRAFDEIGGEVVSTTATVFVNQRSDLIGTYIRLSNEIGEAAKSMKLREAANEDECPWRYEVNLEAYKTIPSWPITYQFSKYIQSMYRRKELTSKHIRSQVGSTLGRNDLFLRLWFEVSKTGIENNTYILTHKGGTFRKWYGNLTNAVYWKDNGEAIKKYGHATIRGEKYAFSEGISWTQLTTGDSSFRIKEEGTFIESASCMCAGTDISNYYLIGMLNSAPVNYILRGLNPTMHFQTGDVDRVPFGLYENPERIEELSLSNIQISQDDYNSFETSWKFESHPLIQPGEPLVEKQFTRWQEECQERFDNLKSNEEELNRIFVRIYHMEGEVPIEVPDDKVSVRRADLVRDVKSLISYGVGCIFGRYSLDTPGLVLADQGSTVADYLKKVPESKLVPDEDNILPITETAWFDDDIVDSFCRFLVAAYGENTLGQNVAFIENALGCDLRTYFAKGFYADHLKTYQKRPIYWLFQSPKKSFSCLVYMHRYDESTVGEILTGYLRPLQGKFRARIDLLEKEKTAKGEKEANRLRAQVQELEEWERNVIYHLAHNHVHIDLDDGVKVNYNKFPHALAKVPGLSDWK